MADIHIHIHTDVAAARDLLGPPACTGTIGEALDRDVAAIMRLLLETGTDPRAAVDLVGRPHTIRELLETSLHPHEAGVLEAGRVVLTDADA